MVGIQDLPTDVLQYIHDLANSPKLRFDIQPPKRPRRGTAGYWIHEREQLRYLSRMPEVFRNLKPNSQFRTASTLLLDRINPHRLSFFNYRSDTQTAIMASKSSNDPYIMIDTLWAMIGYEKFLNTYYGPENEDGYEAANALLYDLIETEEDPFTRLFNFSCLTL